MGEIADGIVDGEICQECCIPMTDTDIGFPVSCNSCDPSSIFLNIADEIERREKILTGEK